MPPKKRAYKHIDKAAQDAMKAQRVSQLEQEHYSNMMALAGAQALPASESKDQQVAQLTANLEALDAVLQALDPA